MRRGIPLHVLIPDIKGYNFLYRADNISSDSRISAFINGDCCCCMGIEQVTYPIVYIRSKQLLANKARDIDQLHFSRCCD